MTNVTTGIYAGHNFPPYEYREYPKHVKKNGKVFTANSKGEELKIASMADEPDAMPQISDIEAALQAALAEIEELKAAKVPAVEVKNTVPAGTGPAKPPTPAAP